MTEPVAPETGAVVPAPSPWKAVILALLILACVGVVYLTPLRDYVRTDGVEELRRTVLGYGNWAPAVFLALCAGCVAIGVPRLILAGLGGAFFGWLQGAALAQVGTLAGCFVTFGVGRGLGREYIEAIVRRRFPRAAALLDLVGRHGFAANVLLRAAPVGNCFATNLLMAVSPVGKRNFLLGTFLGTLPETLILALFGSAAGGHTALRIAVAAVSMALLALGVWLWTRRSAMLRSTT